MKKVFVAQHPTEAHLVKGVLETSGIPAIVRGESLFGARGEAPVTPDTLPTVWVTDDNDAAGALGILAEYGPGAAPVNRGEPWTCPNCHESVEAQFSECWKCGTGRPT
jgi:hypothetical protein